MVDVFSKRVEDTETGSLFDEEESRLLLLKLPLSLQYLPSRRFLVLENQVRIISMKSLLRV